MTDITDRMDAARRFPDNTCPASRHAQMLAERLLTGQVHPSLIEEPEHCGESIAAVVAALYEARTTIAGLRDQTTKFMEPQRCRPLPMDGLRGPMTDDQKPHFKNQERD